MKYYIFVFEQKTHNGDRIAVTTVVKLKSK